MIFDIEDIYYASDGFFEKLIKDEIYINLKGLYGDIDDFKAQIDKN